MSRTHSAAVEVRNRTARKTVASSQALYQKLGFSPVAQKKEVVHPMPFAERTASFPFQDPLPPQVSACGLGLIGLLALAGLGEVGGDEARRLLEDVMERADERGDEAVPRSSTA